MITSFGSSFVTNVNFRAGNDLTAVFMFEQFKGKNTLQMWLVGGFHAHASARIFFLNQKCKKVYICPSETYC